MRVAQVIGKLAAAGVEAVVNNYYCSMNTERIQFDYFIDEDSELAPPQEMIDRLAAAAEEGKAKGVKGLPMKLGMEMAAEMIVKIKDEHLCDGVHIMAIGAEKNVPAILEKAGVTI